MAENKTGWEFNFERTPYGVKITRPKGKMPKALQGYFTDETFAETAVNSYLINGRKSNA